MDRQLRQFVSRQTVLKGTVVIGPRITPITLRAVEETSTMYKIRAASTSRFETNSASPWRTKLDNILLIRRRRCLGGSCFCNSAFQDEEKSSPLALRL